jgi:hypothetical protein
VKKNSTGGAAKEPLNYCATCGRDFGGTRAFDLHRIGKHAYLHSHEHPDGRRCMTEAEMLERGLYLNANGRWGQPASGLSERLGSR